MKNDQKGSTISLLIATVVILAVGGSIYAYKVNNKEASISVSTSASDSLKTYTNSQYGFSFEYPQTWKIIKENDCYSSGQCNTEFSTGNSLSKVYLMINKTTSTTSAKAMRQKELAIINGNYVTPKFGADANYSQQGNRYNISDYTDNTGVHIYQTNFTGKYTIVNRSYYFDTNKGGTIRVEASSVANSEYISDSSFYKDFPEIKQLIASIKITN